MSEFHLSFMDTLPCSILHGIAPDEYKWANEFPFFSENGSAVLMFMSFAEGNSVKPVFGLSYSFLTTVTDFCVTAGFFMLFPLAVPFAGCI